MSRGESTRNMRSESDLDDKRLEREHESKIYMACIIQGRRFGMSYFDAETHAMFVMETYEDETELFPTLQLIKYQVQPLVIYTSTKMDDTFVTALEKRVKEDAEAHDVRIVKSSLFSYQQARHRLGFLRVTGMDDDLNDTERTHLLNSMINLDSEMQVRAGGGLLAILQQEMLINDLEREEYKMDFVQIESISELSLDQFLNVDAATYDALQIFQVDKHASSMGIGKAKEGFSVFGLLNKCVTQAGRKLLRLWFLRPILDLAILNDRLDTVSALIGSQELVSALRDALKCIKDIPRLLKKLSSPSSAVTSKDWAMFTESVNALIHIRRMFEVAVSPRHQIQMPLRDLQIVKKKYRLLAPSQTTKVKIVACHPLDINRQVASLINEDLIYANALVSGVIDFDQQRENNLEMMVANGVCDELDELKNIYEGLPDFLDQIATIELNDLQVDKTSSEAAIVYIPQVGYLLRFGKKNLEEDTLERRPDIQFTFEGGIQEGTFYHTSRTRELDEVVGDILHKILDMEQAILRDLQRRVLVYASTLRQAASVAAEIDCLIALSTVAHDQKFVRPQLSEDNILTIKAGRHPLQECTVNTFVPNDTNIGKAGRVCIISGPNYSGKSIYAKQVALIVFLSHIGSFVPAEEAVIGLTDRIFTRITSKETMAVQQSAFMIDLHQIAVMLRHATARSLCIIDEFGKGTLISDGIGLLCATLHEAASRDLSPKVLACTHFCEVFNESFLPKSRNIAFYTMSILEPQKNQDADDSVAEIVFLYRLVPGRAIPSYGVHCAELAGVPSDILKRCADILENTKVGKPIDRLGSKRTAAMDQIYKTMGDQLRRFDSEKDNVKKFLSDAFALFATK